MKVSIITIVYNNVDFILDCLHSVSNQDYENIEHIVIDGGSSDGTVEKVQLVKDKLAFFESAKDNGLYDALNKGIRQATGDVIGILHSDDLFFSKEVISDVVQAFKMTSCDLVYGNGVYVDKLEENKIRRVYSVKDYKKFYLNFGWIPLHTTIFVKKEVFLDYGLYDDSFLIASDYDISLRWFRNDDIRKHFLDRTLVRMRLGGKSTTTRLQYLKSHEDLQIIKRHKLFGFFTLFFKIARKIPQYIKPLVRK